MDKTPSPSTGSTRRLFSALRFTLLALPARAQPAPAGSEELALRETTADASLGTVWSQSENGWSGVWTRRGDTNVFDGVWTQGSSRHLGTMTITVGSNGAVRIYRRDGNGIEVDYVGTMNARGQVNGTAKVRQTGVRYAWTATVQ